MDIEGVISPLIQHQFPSFYAEEGPTFIAFVKAYYEWLEQANNTIDHARSLLTYRDVDQTPEDFILHFKEKYLKNIEFETTTNKRLLLKHSLDLYRSKGTDRSVDLLFKLIYGTGAEVYHPSVDILKPSDGTWARPYYIEVSDSPRTIALVGKQITGVSSGATAFVETYVKRKVKNRYVHLLYITNRAGLFTVSELLKNTTVYPNLPKVLGSLAQIEVIEGGEAFEVGDIVQVLSASGDYGTARIASIESINGLVDFIFHDGGYGYSNAPSIFISNTVLSVANVTANTVDAYLQFEVVRQPITNITYTGLGGTFVPGVNVFSTTGTGVGRLLAINTTASTMKISRESGTFTATGNVYISGNTANATIATSVNNDITGYVTQSPTNINLEMASASGFGVTQEVFQVSGSETANGWVTKILSNIVSVSNVVGTFVTSLPLRIRNDANTGTISAMSMSLPLHNTSAAFLSDYTPVIYGVDSGPTGRVQAVSSGTGASFNIAGIDNTENVVLNIDAISGNNITATPFLSLALNAATYGFTANSSANLSTTIWNTLSYTTMTIGEITGLTNVNPGLDYSASPAVAIQEPMISAYQRKDHRLTVSNVSSSFSSGERVSQTYTSNAYDLVVASNTGWLIGEHVLGPSGNGNLVSIVGTTFHVSNVQGTFTNGQIINSVLDTTNTTITTATTNNDTIVAFGALIEIDADVYHVAREQFETWFRVGTANLVGTDTGAMAYINHVGEWSNSIVIGLNANVEANVVTANGAATTLGVTDSGFGYGNNKTITFSSEYGEHTGQGISRTTSVGRGAGYFKTTKGFLSADKYLFDGDYYQDYSYEVISKMPFDRYSEMLKKVLHVAGTKAFGSVVLESEVDAINLDGNTSFRQNYREYLITAETRSSALTFLPTTLTKLP